MKSELSANRREAWREIMRRFVGRGKHISFDDLAEQAGVPAGTLRSIAAGDHCPRDDYGVRIQTCLPKAAIDELLRPLGYSAHPIAGKGCHRRSLTATAAMLHKLADAFEDGYVDHREEADMRPEVERVYEEIGKLLNGTTQNIFTLPKEGKVT